MARLFVAVQPPDDVLDAVARLLRPDVKGLRWTSRQQWHVTLRFLGWVEEPGTVIEALAGVAARACEAVLGPSVRRFGHRVLHVPVTGLDAVAEEVVEATRHLGRPPEDRPFAGHLTLARAARGSRVDLRRLEGGAIACRWRATEVTLFESHLSRSGAAYEAVATRKLGPRQGP